MIYEFGQIGYVDFSVTVDISNFTDWRRSQRIIIEYKQKCNNGRQVPDIGRAVKVPIRVLAISTAVEQHEALAAAASGDVLTTIFDGQHSTPSGLLQQLRATLDGKTADRLGLSTHGPGHGGSARPGAPAAARGLPGPS